MLQSSTIDLCPAIPPHFYEEIINRPFEYGEDESLGEILDKRYNKFQRDSDALFEKWLRQSNKELLKNIDEFKRNALDSKKSKYFDKAPETINIATVVLGMQSSDHLPTIDMIEEQIARDPNNIQILRLQSDLNKRALLNIFEEGGLKRHILVIVERAETFKPALLESVILVLSDALRGGKTATAMLMICMSGSWRNMTQTLPPEIVNRVSKVVQLVKDPQETIKGMVLDLLRSDDETFKLGPNLFSMIDYDFLERDASLANLKYLYQSAMFEHLSSPISVLASTKDQLKTVPKSEIIDLLLELPSVKKTAIKNVNPVLYCTTCCTEIAKNHKFLMNQIRYYFALIRDETKINMPSHVQDIYLEVSRHEDLGQSESIYDAIERLRGFPADRIRSRLISSTSTYFENVEDFVDIYASLLAFEMRLKTEENKLAVISDLITRLHSHSKQLKNPMRLPINEAIYFNDESLMRRRVLPSFRHDALAVFTKESTLIGILYKLIHESTETISLTDLYEDFKDKLNLKDESLVKAIFIDLIDCIEYQGLIKCERRSGRKDFMKKFVWL